MESSDKIVMFFPYVAEGATTAVEKIIQSRWIGQGALVDDFEKAVIAISGAPYAAAVSHVSAAIRLALAIIDVGPGDEVITSPQACTAINHPILEQFAVPVFADIHMLTGNIDPNDIEHRITKKTKAVICTHWGGYPCDLEEIHAVASRHNLPVIEDAGDALGAYYKGTAIGNISSFTCFNFQAVQQITTAEGGMLCCHDPDHHQAALRRRWFGIDRINRTPNTAGYHDFDVDETGYGYHMTNIQAAIGLANLKDFNAILKRRRDISTRYSEALLTADGVTLFHNDDDRESACQLFTILVPRRDDFFKAMRDRKVETSIVHDRNDAYTVFGGKRSDLPHLDQFSEQFICIPLHNHLSDEQVEHVIESIGKGW